MIGTNYEGSSICSAQGSEIEFNTINLSSKKEKALPRKNRERENKIKVSPKKNDLLTTLFCSDFDVVEASFASFRIFKSAQGGPEGRYEPVPVVNSPAWMASTRDFPKKFKILHALGENDFTKVKLALDLETGEHVT